MLMEDKTIKCLLHKLLVEEMDQPKTFSHPVTFDLGVLIHVRYDLWGPTDVANGAFVTTYV